MAVEAPPSYFWRRLPVRGYVQRVNVAVRGSGATATSWYRTPRANVAAGGSGRPPFGVGGPLSQHLVGLGSDWATPNTGALLASFRREGLFPVDEFDHVHVQAWPRGTLDRLFT